MNRIMRGVWMAVFINAAGCAPATRDFDPNGPLATAPEAPSIKALKARAAGRWAQHLRVSVEGQDANGDVTGLWVKLSDERGRPWLLFDEDRDGRPESAETVLPPDAPVEGVKAFTASLTFESLLADGQKVAQVEVALVDREGARSAVASATVEPGSFRALGEACDPTYVEDRCTDGMGCWGTPATCREPSPPTVDRAAYLRNVFGPRVLVEGRDPDDDVAFMKVAFFNLAGQPVRLDLNNDGVPDSAEHEVDVRGRSAGGRFFVELQSAPGFEATVVQVVVTLRDSGGRTTPPKTLQLAHPPQRGRGQSCDPRGFDACITDYSCTPGVEGASNVCVSSVTARTQACQAAPVLEPQKGPATLRAALKGTSLWDPPAGCAANDPRGRAEVVVKVVLAAPATKLTLTTARPGTGTDTILSVLSACNEPARLAPLACNDDGPKTSASTVVLTNVAAGEYLVVVDSWAQTSGYFELEARAE
ncbi:MAG: hypothetical protein JNJ54_30940 [Myxococcaceae bacterium]|nr:hypothetical protein [Myxococcaceae bacterium]